MAGEDSSSSPSDDSNSTAAFSLVKYENPEIIEIDDSVGSDKDGESCEEILNSILPPREWLHNGKLWRQSVSASPATRMDVMNLQEQLDHKLQQRQARETGICQVRRELYSQCFDELIRQSTINCVERGLLMLRVRDELKMTLMAYQTLYESSIAFGIRKALKAEQGKAEMETYIQQLESQKTRLEKEVSDLEVQCQMVEKKAVEQRQAEEKVGPWMFRGNILLLLTSVSCRGD